MNPHPKHRTNRLQMLAIARWVVITTFLSAAGLSYNYLKIQLNARGHERTALERSLDELVLQNNALETQIGNLTSRTALQRRLDEGFIKLVPISTQAIVHVRPPETNRRQTADSDQGNQFQTVARTGFVRP